jgi:hypothetical protein
VSRVCCRFSVSQIASGNCDGSRDITLKMNAHEGIRDAEKPWWVPFYKIAAVGCVGSVMEHVLSELGALGYVPITFSPVAGNLRGKRCTSRT